MPRSSRDTASHVPQNLDQRVARDARPLIGKSGSFFFLARHLHIAHTLKNINEPSKRTKTRLGQNSLRTGGEAGVRTPSLTKFPIPLFLSTGPSHYEEGEVPARDGFFRRYHRRPNNTTNGHFPRPHPQPLPSGPPGNATLPQAHTARLCANTRGSTSLATRGSRTTTTERGNTPTSM